jgi:hypothetical protein
MGWQGRVAIAFVGILMLAMPRISPAVIIVPVNPTTADSLKVTAGNDFNSRCWSFSQPACSLLSPDTLRILIQMNYCGGDPGCGCNDFPVSIRRTCNFGLLPAGSYVASYVEQHINPYDPVSTYSQNVTIAVVDAGSVAIRPRSWGALKSTYR